MNEEFDAAQPGAARYPVRSVERALRALLMFRDADDISVAHVAASLGVAPSTAHRLLDMLVQHGFVTRISHGRYRLGTAAIALGLSAMSRLGIRERARPHMETLSAVSRRDVNLAILDDDHVLFIDRMPSAVHASEHHAHVGLRRPAQLTSVGKAILASGDDAVRARICQKLGAQSGKCRGGVQSFSVAMQETKLRGYAVNDAESRPNIRAVGVAIVDPEGRPVAALSISDTRSGMERAEMRHLALAARSAATSIAQTIQQG